MTKEHYSEADLLEAGYAGPPQSTPVMQHLFDCDDCAAKYQRLQEKLRGVNACPPKKAGLLSRLKNLLGSR